MALCLTRREGEGIRIGDGVWVYVRKIQGSRVRLSIVAPNDVEIARTELDDKTEAA